MPRISMWKPDRSKSNDYKYHDRVIREQFFVGGTGAIVHKFLGPEEGPDLDDPTRPDYGNDGLINETSIQDLLLLENRDRKYEKDLYELRGVYNVSDNDFDLTQFGLFLTNDVLYMTFHINDMVNTLGRKLMNGDVIELPHLIEDIALDENTPPIPKFYVVQDGNRGGEGFSPTWWPHIWRAKLGPITDSQEFDDILGNAELDDSMKNLFSTFSKEIDIRDAVVQSAQDHDPIGGGNQLTDHLYNYVDCNGFVYNPGVPIAETGSFNTAFANSNDVNTQVDPGALTSGFSTGFQITRRSGLDLIQTGTDFPVSPNQGEFFIRTDFQPARLFVRKDTKWIRLYDNIDDRTWSDRTFNASTFVNNVGTDVAAGQEYDSRQSITDAILPRDDFDDETGL